MPPGNANDNPATQQQNLDLRSALNDAYAAVEGAKGVQTFTAYTFEDALSAQITDINGPGTDSRPNELQSIQNILNNVMQAAQQIQAMPADQFADPDSQRDVNTPA
jgi:hypothetical protein